MIIIIIYNHIIYTRYNPASFNGGRIHNPSGDEAPTSPGVPVGPSGTRTTHMWKACNLRLSLEKPKR